MSRIADAVVGRMGTGPDATFNHCNTFFGKLSKSHLRKLTRQLNQAVMKGTTSLHSSNSLRITRRSP